MFTSLLLAQVLVISGGTVHSLVPGSEPRIASVVIEDGHIRSIGDDPDAPADAQHIDATGLHIIPGLIDGLVYHDAEHDTLYTAAGVTLVRDQGNDLARILLQRQPEERERRLGPALSICGAVLDGYPPSAPTALVLKDEHVAHSYVPTMIDEGVDFLAVQTNLGEAAWREVLQIAHPAEGRRLQVWGPRPKATSIESLARAGQDGLLFLDDLVPSEHTWEDTHASDCAAVIALLAEQGVRVTPALGGTARMTTLQDAGLEPLALLGPQYGEVWRGELRARREQAAAGLPERAALVLARQGELLLALDAAGVALVPGSGAPHPWLMPGSGLIDELALWQKAGFTPQRCLELATRESAKALELSERGTLAVGNVADLVLLRADPRESVQALREVEAVVLRGTPLDRARLDGGLAKLRAAQDQARAASEARLVVEPPKLPPGRELMRGLVETRTAAGVIAAERWSIVLGPDESLSFCGRRLMPGSADRPPIVADVVQSLRAGKLDSFSVTLRTGGRELLVQGVLVGNQMRVERRMDGGFVDSQAAREALVAIDVSSVTTLLLLAHVAKDGAMPILRFDEALELEVVRWDLKQQENGDHGLRTPSGGKLASFDVNGALRVALEVQGAAEFELVSMEVDTLGGPGLPLPQSKLERVRAARAAEASATTPATDKPTDGDDSDGR